MLRKGVRARVFIAGLALLAVAALALLAVRAQLGASRHWGVPAQLGEPRELSSDWQLYWSDEFDGSSLDTAFWEAYDPGNGRGRYGHLDPDSQQCYTRNNVTVSAGVLTIRSRQERVACSFGEVTSVSSGFIGTREAGKSFPLYARYEMRARVPSAQGVFPAFWLRHVAGSSSAEVDVMESLFAGDPGSINSTLHFPKTLGTSVAAKGVYLGAISESDPQTQWHVWAVDIEQVHPGDDNVVRFTFSVDGRVTLQYVNEHAAQWTGVADSSRVFDIAINTALGGQDVGLPGANLGFVSRGGGKCVLERPQRPTSDPSSCAVERTEGARYNDEITSAPAPDGVPDIWLAPWVRDPSATSEYVVDYVRVYVKQ